MAKLQRIPPGRKMAKFQGAFWAHKSG
jgi:hypothetical protein